MALLPGSPALGAGNNALIPEGVTTDQRGLPRIVDGTVDIGAFESSGFTIAVTSGSGQTARRFAPLVVTVTANNAIEPVAGGLVTFTPPASGASAAITGSPATISASGTASVTATSSGIPGSFTVSATASGAGGAASFSLTNAAPVSIAVSPGNPELLVGFQGQFTATGAFADGSTLDVTSVVTWASATPSVAAISGTGVASGLVPGTSVITASLGGVTSHADTMTVIPSNVVNTTADTADSGFSNGTISLRDAIAAANAVPGQTITFDPTVFASAQTITLTLGQLELSDTSGTETIMGPVAGVTVNAGGLSRVFQVDGGVTASLSGLTITGGSAGNGGGLYNDGGDVTMTDCTISGNSASSEAAATLGCTVSSGGTTTLTRLHRSPATPSTLFTAAACVSTETYGGTTTLTDCTAPAR